MKFKTGDIVQSKLTRALYNVDISNNGRVRLHLKNGYVGNYFTLSRNDLEKNYILDLVESSKVAEPSKLKLRRVGDIMLDMEKLLLELHEDHDLQHGEVLGLINVWQKIHVPDQIETYEDGTHPELYRS